MHPMITTLLGLFFVLAGIICVYTMLEIRGRPKLELDSKVLIKIHKISGYFFALLYIVVLVLMIIKLRNYRVGLSPRANIHILLAVVILPILAIKLAIARVYKKLSVLGNNMLQLKKRLFFRLLHLAYNPFKNG